MKFKLLDNEFSSKPCCINLKLWLKKLWNKLKKKFVSYIFFYLETVILITNELQLRNPVLQRILYYYTDCIRQYKFRRFKNLKTSVRLKTVFLGWGWGGGGHFEPEPKLQARSAPPPIFLAPQTMRVYDRHFWPDFCQSCTWCCVKNWKFVWFP